MPDNAEAAGRSPLRTGLDTGEFDRTDRILLSGCAAVWLAALGAGVAATVALVDLGTRHGASTRESETPWLAVCRDRHLCCGDHRSGAAIAEGTPGRAGGIAAPRHARSGRGRAAAAGSGRRGADSEIASPGRGATGAMAGGPGYASREPISPPLSPVMSAVDQLWLRCAVIIAIAMGVAMVAIGVATYLMAVDDNAAAWVLYVLAGIVHRGDARDPVVLPARAARHVGAVRGVRPTGANPSVVPVCLAVGRAVAVLVFAQRGERLAFCGVRGFRKRPRFRRLGRRSGSCRNPVHLAEPSLFIRLGTAAPWYSNGIG